MGFQIFNFEDNSNVSVVSRKGIFKVIQYDKDLSCTAEDAQTKFYMSQMNVKKRQLMIIIKMMKVSIYSQGQCNGMWVMYIRQQV